MNSATTAVGRPVSGGDRTRVVIVADDYQFLDTTHGVIVAYEWLLATNRERLMQLAEPPPLAFVIDLQMTSVEPLQVLELLGSLHMRSKVFLLAGADLRVIAKAKSLGDSLNLNLGGVLSRPLVLQRLVEQLTFHTVQTGSNINAEELAIALEQSQLLLHYQPIIHRQDNRWQIRGVEAFVRWQHPQRGLLFPGQFLALADNSGLMEPLTHFVMDEAIRQAGLWERQGLDLTVSINLALSQVHDIAFLERLLSLTRKHRVSPGQIMVEVTEAPSIKDREAMREMFMRLRMQGIGLTLDDFGTGYSSLTELYRLPFSNLKIDRLLVNDVPQSREASTIVAGIIDLVHRLSIRVCAECVETPAAFAFLEQAGCDAMQGILIAKPATVLELEPLFENWTEDDLPSVVAA